MARCKRAAARLGAQQRGRQQAEEGPETPPTVNPWNRPAATPTTSQSSQPVKTIQEQSNVLNALRNSSSSLPSPPPPETLAGLLEFEHAKEASQAPSNPQGEASVDQLDVGSTAEFPTLESPAGQSPDMLPKLKYSAANLGPRSFAQTLITSLSPLNKTTAQPQLENPLAKGNINSSPIVDLPTNALDSLKARRSRRSSEQPQLKKAETVKSIHSLGLGTGSESVRTDDAAFPSLGTRSRQSQLEGQPTRSHNSALQTAWAIRASTFTPRKDNPTSSPRSPRDTGREFNDRPRISEGPGTRDTDAKRFAGSSAAQTLSPKQKPKQRWPRLGPPQHHGGDPPALDAGSFPALGGTKSNNSEASSDF